MFSTDDLKASIGRWLSTQETHLSFTIEQHQCELIKAGNGVKCLISIDAVKGQVPPNLLLQLIQAGLKQFSGAPVLNPDGQYMLGVWQTLTRFIDTDSEKLLAIIETLSNQAAVWNELLSPSPTRAPRPISPQNDMLRFASRLSQHPTPF